VLRAGAAAGSGHPSSLSVKGFGCRLVEALGLLADRLSLEGPFWRAISALNENFGTLGFAIGWAVLGQLGGLGGRLSGQTL